jgi:Tol biopolymer transport system component
MKFRMNIAAGARLCLPTVVLFLAVSGMAASGLRGVNPRGGSPAPISGGGDSQVPVMTSDGRFVLFSSTANNLVTRGTNQPMPLRAPARLNVFLRDRLNQTTVLVSVNAQGTAGGNGDSYPVAVSSNGLYALFESMASDLVPNDTNNAADVFLRNLVTGSTVLISAATNGVPGDGLSEDSVMTPDAHYVAFSSAARNLLPGDTNDIADVFVRDTQAGTTLLVSVGAQPIKGAFNGTNASLRPLITPDGRYVAFLSTASNLVAGVTNLADIYVRDILGGTSYWASSYARTALKAANNTTAGICYGPVLSADGQFVAYQVSRTNNLYPWPGGLVLRYSVASGASDLLSTNATVVNGDYVGANPMDISGDGRFVAFVSNTNGTSGSTTCVYLWDAQLGYAYLASGDLSNSVPTNSTCCNPVLDPEGKWLAFLSSAQTLVTNALGGASHLFLRDLQSNSIRVLDGDTNGNGAGVPYYDVPALSGDARFVVFESDAPSLVPDDRNRRGDVFVRDLVYGTNELISVRAAALPSATPNGSSSVSYQAMSADGSRIVFASDADDLVANDGNGWRDVYVRDLNAAATILASVNTNGVSGNLASFEGNLSGNGRCTVFSSRASDLVAGDTNNASDIFLRDLEAQTTTLVSVNSNSTAPADGDSFSPIVSANGRFVAFRSKAKNLVATGVLAGENFYLRDLQLGTNYALTTTGKAIQSAEITPDGRFLAFASSTALSVWGTEAGAVVFTTNISTISGLIGVSPDGNRVAFNSNSNLWIRDIPSGSNYLVAATAACTHPGLRFSGDGRWLTYVLCSRPAILWTNQVYLYDALTGSNTLVSRSYDGAGPGNGPSDWPEITPNGRFIAYRSRADNLVPGGANARGDVFLYDRQSGTTTLLSANNSGTAAGDNMSLFPIFSGDGATLLFESWASDLVTNDFNQTLNVVAYSLFAAGEIPVFSARVISAPASAGSPTLNWPVIAGKSYRVQFKDAVLDASWQEVGGGVTILGNQGYFVDPAPSASARFYRVVAN